MRSIRQVAADIKDMSGMLVTLAEEALEIASALESVVVSKTPSDSYASMYRRISDIKRLMGETNAKSR
jgi:hypothetical protein